MKASTKPAMRFIIFVVGWSAFIIIFEACIFVLALAVG